MYSDQVPAKDLLVNAIIQRLCSISHQMVILFDHDSLVSSTVVFERIADKGFDLYDYTDNLSLYFYLENKRRMNLESENRRILIRVSADLVNLAQVPYSVLMQSDVIHLRLDDFFTGIAAKAVRELPSQYFEKLYELLQTQAQNLASYSESIDFIARRILGIDTAGISTELQFWAVLFKLHYKDTVLPEFIVNNLLNVGKELVDGYDIDLDRVLKSREYFYAFLQKEWRRFVDKWTCSAEYPRVLPFDHPDLKVYTDNFFTEGLLQRITLATPVKVETSWMACGIERSPLDNVALIQSQLSLLNSQLPGIEDNYQAWQKYAKHYARLLQLLYTQAQMPDIPALDQLRVEANSRFRDWVIKHYDSLSSLPATEPILVHQIARSMAYRRAEQASPQTALIILDGMSYDQWLCIHSELDLSGSKVQESALFAWLPTLTSISRQAIFCAQLPFYFASSLTNNSKESSQWKRFWEDAGQDSNRVHYLRLEGTEAPAIQIEKEINLNSASVIGIVINTIDNMLHGMNLGASGMHSQIRHWLKQGHLAALLKLLLDKGFELWLSSDHGNLACSGIGNIADGALSETKAARTRIYASEALAVGALEKSGSSLLWTPKGIPPQFHCLFAPYQASYLAKGKKSISHGGISLEELMVPLIKINRT
ncbi:MAG: BREX-3 system phosphatase PglZ [Candidatus Cloacimonetes bacterium]|nr:BREX-3 system phosphatase PglZ [Candidatus Cloacimonadota bacterium]